MTATLDTQHQNLFEELDYRENHGIEVSLLWNRNDDSLTVVAFETRENSGVEIPVEPHQARDVFEHPYAYVGVCQ